MPEVSPAGEHHRKAMFVSGSDDLLILDRPAGLDDRRRTGSCYGIESVAKRNECVRGCD